jgi:nicotinamide mononucleotide transporter
MSLNEIWQNFISNIRETKWQEWVSTVTQVASVVYARKNNVLVYPTGIIGVLLAAYVYFFQTHPPLYADASLNVY